MGALVSKTIGRGLALLAIALPLAQAQPGRAAPKVTKKPLSVEVSLDSASGAPDHFKGAFPVPSDLGFALGSVQISQDANEPAFASKIVSNDVEVSAILRSSENEYTRQIVFTEKAPSESALKRGSRGTRTLPAKKPISEVRTLAIYIRTKHSLIASALTTHYYVFDGGGEISRLNLGLQEVPDNVLRIGVLNDSPFKTAVPAARAILTDGNGAPVTGGLSVAYNKTVQDPSALSVPAGDIVLPHSDGERKNGQSDLVIPSHGYRVLTVNLKDAQLNPGLYSGVMQLDSAHPKDTTNFAFKLDVRAHPFKALVAILIGLLVGYTLFWLNGVRQAYTQQLGGIAMSIRSLEDGGLNQHILDLFQWHYDRLKDRVDPDETDPNQSFLVRIQRLLTWKDRVDPALDSTLSADLSKFRAVISSTSILMALEARAIALLPSGSEALSDIESAITLAWASIAKFDVTAVGNAIQGIESALFVPSTPAESAPANDAAPEVVRRTDNVSLASEVQPSTQKPAGKTDKSSNLKVHVATVGSVLRRKVICDPNDLRGSVRNIQVLRSFVASFAMVLLLFTGLNLLYVGVQGFGHSIYDYLKAVAWGFSAGAAGRGLSTTIASWASNILP